MKTIAKYALAAALVAAAGSAQAQSQEVRTPEGALMQVDDDLAYKPGELSEAQLEESTRGLMTLNGMNVFRRFPREDAEAVVKFYVDALGLRSLNPIQLTATQQMILTGVGSAQIKLSAGQQSDRLYNLDGGATGGTGIRYFRLTYPDAEMVRDRFAAAGFAAPDFMAQDDGTMAALVTDPAGFPIEIVIEEGAQDGSNDGVGVGIGASDLAESQAFYREFVGLDELPPVEDELLGITRYPFRHGETTLYLHDAGATASADNGSAGIQYVVSDAPMVDAKAKHRDIAVETPLNKLAGFDLTTVWLNDPDGVTNYFAQVGRSSQPASNGGR